MKLFLYNLDPDSWKKVYPDCGGKEQSPINLETSGLNVITSFPIKALSFSLDYFLKNGISGFWAIDGHTGKYVKQMETNRQIDKTRQTDKQTRLIETKRQN